MGLWPLLVVDFQVILHVDLVTAWRKDRRPFAWFHYQVQGLLNNPASTLRRRLVPEPEQQQQQPNGGVPR